MKSGDLLSHSQQSTTCLSREPDQYSPCRPHPTSRNPILILSSYLRLQTAATFVDYIFATKKITITLSVRYVIYSYFSMCGPQTSPQKTGVVLVYKKVRHPRPRSFKWSLSQLDFSTKFEYAPNLSLYVFHSHFISFFLI
jgi:hypothetical protein